MSLDCYPFGKEKTINLPEQPIAIDVAYSEDLLISIADDCHSIVVYDLSLDKNNLIKKITLGQGIVVEQVLHNQAGDYLACIGHKNGQLCVYAIFNWRSTQEARIIQLGTNVDSNDQERLTKLNCINCCQISGNLAACCGDVVLIYKFICDDYEENEIDTKQDNEDTDSFHSRADTVKDLEIDETRGTNVLSPTNEPNFRHIITIKLSMWATKVNLVEDYLSVTALDHVQVLKLELLALQIQSDGFDGELSTGSQTEPTTPTTSGSVETLNFNVAQSETTSTSTNMVTSSSLISDTNSTATTNFSSFNNNFGEQINNSDMSIITMNQRTKYGLIDPAEINCDSTQSTDDCITWNLNTKKLVKLPTLMHNTSTDLSSFHICHPLELLGPASESIACRVSASIYSQDYGRNQLEAVVMLCQQFDFDRDPVKSSQLHAIYLSNHEYQRRSSRTSQTNSTNDHNCNGCQPINGSTSCNLYLLRSTSYDKLSSVTCFVSTLTNTYVYALHAKEVQRIQKITNPDICLDLRPDLLNLFLLTPLGLQICSTGICDSTFRYDWSSSADLSLKFLAIGCFRVLTSANYIILMSSLDENSCHVKYIRKPDLNCLYNDIVHTVIRCNSISIRSNLLTYLHASALLAFSERHKIVNNEDSDDDCDVQIQPKLDITTILKTVSIMLAKQLLQKKQTNIIMNSRIDKTIKHLLDISMCELADLMELHLGLANQFDDLYLNDSCDKSSNTDIVEQQSQNDRLTKVKFEIHSIDEDTRYSYNDDEPLFDANYELIRIYLKHSKFSQSILEYLIDNSDNETIYAKLIAYMTNLNPRLLIKCAQRFPLNMSNTTATFDDNNQSNSTGCIDLLVQQLSQLAEVDSTGINRSTVLFTLAILYNALGERFKCLASLSQIKPPTHLAITMYSHRELVSNSIANVISANFPDVFKLYIERSNGNNTNNYN